MPPTFTASSFAPPSFPAQGSSSATMRPAASGATAVAEPPRLAAAPTLPASPVGTSLSTSEIRTLLTHAGTGCPLGPCKGCPHHEVTTGACKA
jgi:hypothetical protein